MTKVEDLKNYPDVLVPKDLRKILHLGRAATYKLLAAGEIPNFKIGRTYQIPKAALESYLRKRVQEQREGEQR